MTAWSGTITVHGVPRHIEVSRGWVGGTHVRLDGEPIPSTIALADQLDRGSRYYTDTRRYLEVGGEPVVVACSFVGFRTECDVTSGGARVTLDRTTRRGMVRPIDAAQRLWWGWFNGVAGVAFFGVLAAVSQLAAYPISSGSRWALGLSSVCLGLAVYWWRSRAAHPSAYLALFLFFWVVVVLVLLAYRRPGEDRVATARRPLAVFSRRESATPSLGLEPNGRRELPRIAIASQEEE